MNEFSKKPIPGNTDGGILHNDHPALTLAEEDGRLVMTGTDAGIKDGITRFLKGGLLENFRFVRTLYHHDAAREMVLDSLISTHDKIAAILEEHYGPVTYSKHISAFDEYLESMRTRYGFTVTDEQIAHHAGVASIDDLETVGFDSRKRYLINKVSYEERERMLIDNGGFTYKEWMGKEIDRFLADPSLLIQEYDCVFENIFPGTVQVDAEKFAANFAEYDTVEAVTLVFGKKSTVTHTDAGGTDTISVDNIPVEYREYWK